MHWGGGGQSPRCTGGQYSCCMMYNLSKVTGVIGPAGRAQPGGGCSSTICDGGVLLLGPCIAGQLGFGQSDVQ